jgi:lycopene beta-cyclase
VRRSGPVPVPRSLQRELGRRYEHVILGAGCAGLSLCHYLLERGVEGGILILDRRSTFEDDRTWCFWDVEPTPFSHLATRRWSSWRVRAGGRDTVQTSERYPYLCLTGRDFYEHALDSIASRGDVTLALGEDVEGYWEVGGEVVVRSSGGDVWAGDVFDARGLTPDTPVFQEARRTGPWVPQIFFGMRLRTRREVFDPEVCTLMDFVAAGERGLRFVYVLPFGPREALVENVYLSEVSLSRDDHRAELAGYLRDAYGLGSGDYAIDGEEAGYIPMTTFDFPRRLGERARSVGMLGGESRPSTGYTFLRIQRLCRALARSVETGGELVRVHQWRLRVLDGIFLRFLLDRPGEAPDVYARMFARTDPDALVRFLTERSTPRDEARLVAALPKVPFLKTVVRTLLRRQG